jgi:hypothetical protein
MEVRRSLRGDSMGQQAADKARFGAASWFVYPEAHIECYLIYIELISGRFYDKIAIDG